MCATSKSIYEFENIFELVKHFRTEKKCLDFIIHIRWGGKVKCVEDGCEGDKIWKLGCGKLFKCSKCGRIFSALVGTVFQDTKIPLQKWIMAMYLIGIDKKGISTRNLAKKISVSTVTAWFLLHRIRETFTQSDEKLSGIVEADESFVGGKNKNRHIDKKVKNSQGRSFKDKVPVFGVLERGGKLKAKIIANTQGHSINPALNELVEKGSTLYSDEWLGYKQAGKNYQHTIVDHRRRQFRNGDACTNGIEGAWAHLKRMIYGIYHQVSRKHLQRYLNEFVFRFNTRAFNEAQRLRAMMENMCRPLKYKHLISIL